MKIIPITSSLAKDMKQMTKVTINLQKKKGLISLV